MNKILLGPILLFLSLPGMAQSKPPGIQLGTYALSQGITNIANQLKWQITTAPIAPAGTLFVSYSGNVTGSPSGCNVGVIFSNTNIQSSGATFGGSFAFSSPTFAITPGAAPFAFRIGTAATSLISYTTIAPVYTCSVFPVSGQITMEFVPESVQAPFIFNYLHIASNGTFILKAGAPGIGQLHTIVINQPGTGETITIYDNTTCTGTTIAIIAGLTASSDGFTLTYDVGTTTGLCIATTGTTPGDYTVSYR
jgi:hypothetical protein